MRDHSLWRGFAVTWAVCVALILLLAFALSGVGTRSTTEQAAALRGAVLRAVVTCYAVEGRYPRDAAYLREYYGLTYDADRFIVSLDAFATTYC
jgi:hypothetical protein